MFVIIAQHENRHKKKQFQNGDCLVGWTLSKLRLLNLLKKKKEKCFGGISKVTVELTCAINRCVVSVNKCKNL